jgi:16S rRNA U1498 N3-methylase RsmE
MIIKGKFTSTYANFVLSTKENIHYIYNVLKYNKNNIMDLANYSVKIGHIQYEKLTKLKIKIPKNKQFITDLEPYFNTIEQLQEFIKTCDTLYKQYIQELADDAISKD